MKAVMRLQGKRLVLTEDGWAGPDKLMVRYLNAFFPYEVQGASDPNPLARIAQAAAQTVGADIVRLPATEYRSGRDY